MCNLGEQVRIITGYSALKPCHLFCAEEGQDFAEYALIAALVISVAAIAFTSFGSTFGSYIAAVIARVAGFL